MENWPVLVAGIAVLTAAGLAVYRFTQQPSQQQLSKVREWLLWAVTEAEKELGGGTGELKLRQVYDKFVTRFPVLSKLMPFGVFSKMVDQALEQMRDMLAKNQAANAFVNGAQVK